MLGCSCLCPSHHSAAATRSGRPPVPVVRFSHLNERPAAAPPAPQSPACTTRAMLPCRTGRTSSPQSVLQPSRPCLTSSCSWLQSCRQRASTLRRPARCAYQESQIRASLGQALLSWELSLLPWPAQQCQPPLQLEVPWPVLCTATTCFSGGPPAALACCAQHHRIHPCRRERAAFSVQHLSTAPKGPLCEAGLICSALQTPPCRWRMTACWRTWWCRRLDMWMRVGRYGAPGAHITRRL